MFFAELDDVFGGDRADAVDRVELLDGGGAEADRPSFFAGGARHGTGWPTFGDDHLLAVGEARRQVDRFQLRLRLRPAGALDGVVDPAAGGQAVDAWVGDGAGDVDDQVPRFAVEREPGFARPAFCFGFPGAGVAFIPGGVGLGRAPSPALAADRAGADQQQGDGDGAVDEGLGAADFGHRPIVPGPGARVVRGSARRSAVFSAGDSRRGREAAPCGD